MIHFPSTISGLTVAAGVLAAGLALGAASEKAPVPQASKPPLGNVRAVAKTPSTPTPACEQARGRAKQLLAEFGNALPAQAKSAAEQYAAKPGPGVSTDKGWSDFAAGVALAGDAKLAAWAGLKATENQWNTDTATDAGVYAFHAGKIQDAQLLLNCAYAKGGRSPYLLEALAVLAHKTGNVAAARQYIQNAQQQAPDDLIIETEASFLMNGRPPPPPPRPPDGLDEAMRELQSHATRASNWIKAEAARIDRAQPGAKATGFADISVKYFQDLLRVNADQVRQARAMADPNARQMMINSVLGVLITSYDQITDTMLTFPDTTETNASPLIVWANALNMDPPVLARERRDDAISWSMHGAPGPALAQGAYDAFTSGKEAGWQEHNTRERACSDNSCRIRENARWCGVWKSLHERWANDSRARHNTAAHRFDLIATRTLINTENELLQVRDYAVRQVRKMRFPVTPGFDVRKMTLAGLNTALKRTFEKQLATSDSMGTVSYLRERAHWFETERDDMERFLTDESEKIKHDCEPVMRALFELLAQEEWQAYLDHLRDRLAWDIQGKVENEFPCEGSIGPFTVTADLAKSGEGKFDLKWKANQSLSLSGSVTLRQDQTLGVSVGAGVKQGDFGGSGTINENLEPGLGGGGTYGPFAGKGRATFTSKVSPWNSREYFGIKLKGSAGFGLGSKTKGGMGMGVACYPSSGSVTFYPRAFLEDSIRYMSTPSTRP